MLIVDNMSYCYRNWFFYSVYWIRTLIAQQTHYHQSHASRIAILDSLDIWAPRRLPTNINSPAISRNRKSYYRLNRFHSILPSVLFTAIPNPRSSHNCPNLTMSLQFRNSSWHLLVGRDICMYMYVCRSNLFRVTVLTRAYI